MNWMPIQDTGIAVPFSVLNEEWAQRNHGQSLARLAERGGLDPTEALAIAERRLWEPRVEEQALLDLVTLVRQKIRRRPSTTNNTSTGEEQR